MIGIYDCFGYGPGYDIPFPERYILIKEAGFNCVMLWWSDQFGRGDGYEKDVEYARVAGLQIENIHAPVHEADDISNDTKEGEHVFQSYCKCVDDCVKYNTPTVVIHAPNDENEINSLGITRFKEIIRKAERENVKVAFENLRNISNLRLIIGEFGSTNVGFCYDSCHHANYAPNEDLLSEFGNHLMAIHLQDNGGMRNQHQLPFDGNVDFKKIAKKLNQLKYQGATTIEPMNWGYEKMTIQEFLALAFDKAKKIDDMRKA